MRSDNLGRVAELVIPAKIGLTKRFFEQPDLPNDLKNLRRRSISNAYIRAVDYLRVENRSHWLMGVKLLGRAVAADPFHLPHIIAGFARPFGWHGKRLLAVLKARLRLRR